MKINIVGDGSFGSFLKEILAPHFEFSEDAESVILAVPISAYNELGAKFKDQHLINVCSVQKPSTDILLKYTDRITSIHPLFGRRTPIDKRNSIVTHFMRIPDDLWLSDDVEQQFFAGFMKVSKMKSAFLDGHTLKKITPEIHDIMMAKTHLAALIAGEQAKIFVERAKDIPDEFIPHSFRLLREFVKTMEDMPQGTIESIKANPY